MGAYYILPKFSYSWSNVIVVCILTVFITLSFFSLGRYELDEYIKILLLFLIVPTMYYFVGYEGDIHYAISVFIKEMLMFSPFFFYIIIDRLDSLILKKYVLTVLMIMWAIVLFKTLIEMQVNPTVARLLATGVGDQQDYLRARNIGGFGFSYATGFLIPVLIYLFFQAESKINRFIVAIFTIIVFVYCIKAQYTILLIVMALGLVYIFVANREGYFKLLAYMIVFSILFVLPRILSFIGNMIPGEVLARRFTLLGEFTANSNSSFFDLNTRTTLYKQTIDIWLRDAHSFMFGTSNLSGLDSHSTLLELLAFTGITGGVGYLLIVFKCFNLLHNYCIGSRSKYYTGTFISYLLLLFLNPVFNHYEIGMVLWLIIPLVYDVFANKGSCAEYEINT